MAPYIPSPSVRRLVALLGLSAVWLLVLCAPALAHSRLKESYPADGDTQTQSPQQVQLQFNESIAAEFDPIKVYDEQGNRVDKNNARVDPDNHRLILIDLEDNLPDGSYTVDWRVTSADGHPVGETYGFSVDSSASGSDVSAAQPIIPIVPAAEQESSSGGGISRLAIIGIVAVVVVAALGGVLWRRQKRDGKG